MSSQTHSITLTAKATGVTQSFDAIKRSALEDVRALQQMGKEGSRSLREIETAAKNAQGGMERFRRAQTDLAIGSGAIAAGFTLAARSTLDQQRSIDSLMRSYGDAGQEIIDFTNRLEDQSNFSDEAARAAAAFGATLVNEYGLSLQQVEALLVRAADLAEQRGISFEDAAQRVTAAVRGEAEGIEILGAATGDQALGLDRMAASTTNAEKAQIRFNAIMSQTSQAAGTAQAASEGTRGAVIDLMQSLGDAAQEFVEFTGPVGESAAALSDYSLQAGLALAGVGKLATGLRDLGAASKIASLAMGPTGLVLAAGAATVALGLLLTRTSDLEEVQNASASATTSFANELARLGAIGSEAEGDFARVSEMFGELLLLQTGLQEMQQQGGGQTGGSFDEMSADEINDIKDAILELFGNPFVDSSKVAARLAELFGQFRQGDIDSDELRDSIVEASEAWSQFAVESKKAGDASKQTTDELNALGRALAGLPPATGGIMDRFTTDLQSAKSKGVDPLREAIAAATEEMRAPILDPTNMAGSSGKLARELEAIGGAAGVAGDIARDRAVLLGDSLEANTITIESYRQQIADIAEPFLELARAQAAVGEALVAAGDLFGKTATTIDGFSKAAEKAATHRETLAGIGGALVEAGNLFGTTAETIDGYSESLREAEQATIATAHSLGVLNSLAEQLRPIDLQVVGADRATGHAAILEGIADGLDSVLGVYQTIDSLNKRAESAGSIAENLIGKPGEAAPIDDLLARGKISQTLYNEAVESGYRIQQRQASVEEDLNVIRTRQLSLLNEADQAYAREIDRISHLSAEEQTVALGFMDANEQMAIQESLALAAAAAQTEVGSSSRQAAEEIIRARAETDPVFRAMAEDIELITTDKEGNITVNFDNADTLDQAVKDLSSSIDDLTAAILGIPPSANTDITVTGTEAAVDNAHAVRDAINELNDRTITVGVRHVNYGDGTDIGPVGDGTGMALGGMVGAAGGRLIDDYQKVRVNEGGIEMATLPTGDDVWLQPGTMVWPHAASVMGNRGGGGGKTINIYGGLTIVANNPSEFWDQMNSYGLAGR